MIDPTVQSKDLHIAFAKLNLNLSSNFFPLILAMVGIMVPPIFCAVLVGLSQIQYHYRLQGSEAVGPIAVIDQNYKPMVRNYHNQGSYHCQARLQP